MFFTLINEAIKTVLKVGEAAATRPKKAHAA